ncbi:hypothetical protein L208DRAFT_1137175, partial [Tricholoma matsutake]
YRTNIKNRKNTQGTPLVPLQLLTGGLAKGNPKLKLWHILQGVEVHLAKGNPK